MAAVEPTRELSTARLLALADGIFAIAMTLLVFEIKVPTGAATEQALISGLMAMWPKFASCGLSFLTLGYAWIGHHNQYVAIRRTDRTFLWINVAFLCAIALVPFSSALLGDYPGRQIAVVTYALNLVVAGSLLLWHWTYATGGHRLTDTTVPLPLISATKRRVLVAPLSYLVAIAVSFLSVEASVVICFLVPLYFMFPGAVDAFWKTPKA